MLALRTLANVPRFVPNRTISTDLYLENLDDFVGYLSTSVVVGAGGSQAIYLRELAP